MNYALDYINFLWAKMTPSVIREPIQLSWGASVMKGKQWFHDATLSTYAFGDNIDSAYNPGATYLTGMRAIYYLQSYTSGYTGGSAYYGDNAVYEAIAINPDGSNTTGFSNIPPTGGNVVPNTPPASALVSTSAALAWLSQYSWVQVSPDFLGVQERASYSCLMLIFEYALNRWFKTTFRQPGALWNTYGNDPVNNASETPDIWFGQLDDIKDDMYLGVAQDTAFLGIDNDPTTEYMMISNPGGVSPYDFTINVPIAVYNALTNLEATVTVPNTSPIRNGIVYQFANLINAAGMNYTILTY